MHPIRNRRAVIEDRAAKHTFLSSDKKTSVTMPGLFGKKEPREHLRQIISTVRRQKYAIQRETNQLIAQRKRLEADIKKRAKDNRLDEAKILTRELIAQRKAIKRLYMASSQLDTIVSELQIQSSMGKMAGCMQQSTAVMKAMSQLIKVSPSFVYLLLAVFEGQL